VTLEVDIAEVPGKLAQGIVTASDGVVTGRKAPTKKTAPRSSAAEAAPLRSAAAQPLSTGDWPLPTAFFPGLQPAVTAAGPKATAPKGPSKKAPVKKAAAKKALAKKAPAKKAPAKKAAAPRSAGRR